MLNPYAPQALLLLGLTFACAFWAPWGPAITLPVVSMAASRVFVIFAILLIAYWAIFTRHKFRSFPTTYNLLMLLMVVHTVITYGYFHREEFQFYIDADTLIDESTMYVAQGRGRLVARYFLNAIFAYALASSIRTRRDLTYTALALGLGFSMMMIVSNRATISYSEGLVRSAGGFLNPNDFGQTAMVVVFLSALPFLIKHSGPVAKGIAAISLVFGLYGVLASASRGAMVALCIGFAAIMWYSNFSFRLRMMVAGILAMPCMILLIPDETWNTLTQRASVETVVQTRGSMRFDINRDYLLQFPKYAAVGVGLMRAEEVTRETYTTPTLKIPHNTYLQILVEFGSVGFVLFILSLVHFHRGLSISPRRGPPSAANALMLGFFFAWVGLMLVASGDTRIFFFSWAILAACRRLNMEEESMNRADVSPSEVSHA